MLYNPKILKSGAIQKYGRHPPQVNAAKVARNYKQAGAKGNTEGVNAEMLSCPGSVPEESNTFDLDMEPKAVEEQTGDEKLDEMDTRITAMDRTGSRTTKRHDHSMASSDETVTIGSDGLLPVEPAGKPDKTGAIKDHDMSPDPETHETSTTADHAMDLTGEPVRTYTSADHGKKRATNPDETSNTADLEKTPTQSPNNQNVETKHFNLLGCPDNVRQKILRYLLVSDHQIKPYWNLGSLEVAERYSHKENFAPFLAAFASNSQLINEATPILYGENTFNLRHARVTLWWLRRIGPTNVPKLKHLTISVEEGPMAPSGTRFESLWYSIVLVLDAVRTQPPQPLRLQLHSLHLNFASWTYDIGDDGLDPRFDAEVWEPRRGAVRTLLRFRGVGGAVVVEPGPVVNEYSAGVLRRALGMGPGRTDWEIVDLEARIRAPAREAYYF